MPERITIIEEVPRVETHVVEGDAVRVSKHVEERQETVDPRLLAEDLEVRRVPMRREVDAPEPVRQEGDTTVISVHEQIAVVTTRWVVVEEIHLQRHVREHRSPETITLSRERADVDRIPAAPSRDKSPHGAPRVP